MAKPKHWEMFANPFWFLLKFRGHSEKFVGRRQRMRNVGKKDIWVNGLYKITRDMNASSSVLVGTLVLVCVQATRLLRFVVGLL